MNQTLVLVALITAVPPTLVALVGLILGMRGNRENKAAIQEVHYLINSRMTELLDVSKASSRAEGVLEGKGK